MYRLFWHFISVSSFISFIMLVYVILLISLKKRINPKLWKILCFIPLVGSVIHFVAFYLHAAVGYTIGRFLFMYLFSLAVIILPFIVNKKRLFKIMAIILICFGIFSYLATFYATIMDENIHNLTYDSYTNSFKKTLDILQKEYVLNEHKKIDYKYLYSKYYPLVKQAQDNNDEQLYFKTMFEFTKNFYDGHLYFYVYYTTLDETIKKYAFVNDYQNKDYGFASVLLSNGQVVAVLVDQESDAYKQGLRDGMIITKKDNIDIREALQKVKTSLSAYPVLEDEELINSFYLFATGNDTINVSFINEFNEEKTITVTSSQNENSKPDLLYNKIMYYPDDLENLETKMLDKNTGYIYVANEMYSPLKGAIGYLFDDSSYLTKVVQQKLELLKEQGMENLIIDLRANSGGYLTESEAIASLFTSDNYLVTKEFKNNSKFADKSYLKGNGKYEDMPVYVLVNADTASAGDALTYMLSKCPNVTIIGFTNSNNSCQSVGGLIFLSGGTSYISYPIYTTHDANEEIFIDTDSTRIANVVPDYRVPLTKESILEIIDSEDDYLLNLALERLN